MVDGRPHRPLAVLRLPDTGAYMTAGGAGDGRAGHLAVGGLPRGPAAARVDVGCRGDVDRGAAVAAARADPDALHAVVRDGTGHDLPIVRSDLGGASRPDTDRGPAPCRIPGRSGGLGGL